MSNEAHNQAKSETSVSFPPAWILLLLVLGLGVFVRAMAGQNALIRRAGSESTSIVTNPSTPEAVALHGEVSALAARLTELSRAMSAQQEAVHAAAERSEALHTRVNQLIALEQQALQDSRTLSESVETNLSAILDAFLQSQRDLNALKDKAGELEAVKRTLEEEQRLLDLRLEGADGPDAGSETRPTGTTQ